jgi:3-oxoacyl-[acyl-carrier-protein] synthase II
VTKRVVITGVGIISSLGESLPEVLHHMTEGLSAFKEVANENDNLLCRYTGCYESFDVTPYMGKKGIRQLNRCTRMLLAATGLALKDGLCSINAENQEDVGVILATNFGVEANLRDMERIIFTEGADSLSPLTSFYSSINAVASQVSIRMKAKAFNITVPAGFTSGIDSILLAKNLISSGGSRRVLVGGAEEIPMGLLKEYDRNGILAQCPSEMLPFSLRSKGIILGDGAMVLLLEDLECALARGANIYAEVDEGFIAFSPERFGEGSEVFVRNDLENFLVKNLRGAGMVDLIMSSANGSQLDGIEKNIYRELFSQGTLITAIKNQFGEGFSFTNLLQVGLGASALKVHEFPGILTLNQLQGEVVELSNRNNEQLAGVQTVLVNSVGLDGTYGSVVLKRFSN